MLHRDVSWIRTCAVTTALDGLGTLAGVGGGNRVTRSRVTKGSKSDEQVASTGRVKAVEVCPGDISEVAAETVRYSHSGSYRRPMWPCFDGYRLANGER